MDPDDVRVHELGQKASLLAKARHQLFEAHPGRRQPLEADHGFLEPGGARRAAGRLAVKAVPAGQERHEQARLDRRDGVAQPGERATLQPPEHVRVTPLGLDTARAQLAAHQDPALVGLDRTELVLQAKLPSRVGRHRAERLQH